MGELRAGVVKLAVTPRRLDEPFTCGGRLDLFAEPVGAELTKLADAALLADHFAEPLVRADQIPRLREA